MTSKIVFAVWICVIGYALAEPPVAPYPAAGNPFGSGGNDGGRFPQGGLPEVTANAAFQDSGPTHTITFNLFKDHEPRRKDGQQDQNDFSRGGYQGRLPQGRGSQHRNAQPPSSSYGPPQSAARNFQSPSNSYGPPQNIERSGQQASNTHSFAAQQRFQSPPQTYGTPQNYQSPSQTYGTPLNYQSSALSHGTPETYQSPSQAYGAPQQNAGGAGGFSSRTTPSTQYGTPQNYAGQQSPSGSFGSSQGYPSQTYASQQRNSLSSNYGPPSQNYGTPRMANNQFNGNSLDRSNQQKSLSARYGAPSSSYGPPESRMGYSGFGGYAGGSRSFDGGDSSEMPHEVNYEFQYEVHADNTHSHEESREGEDARGSYRVQLPDGRVQLVEYTADSKGFRPRISYLSPEEAAARDASASGGGPY